MSLSERQDQVQLAYQLRTTFSTAKYHFQHHHSEQPTQPSTWTSDTSASANADQRLRPVMGTAIGAALPRLPNQPASRIACAPHDSTIVFNIRLPRVHVNQELPCYAATHS